MSSIDKRGKAFRARVRRKGFKAKSRTLPTKKAAEAWAHVTETLLTNGVDAVPDRRAEYTLAEALERYKAEVSSAKKGARQEGLRIATWQRHRLAALKLSALAPAHFNEYIREREADGASGSTILNELSLISSAFKKAQKSWGMPYLQNPIQYVDKPRPNAPRDRRLTQEESARFMQALEACRRPIAKQVILFALLTAARQGEILKLQWLDVDSERRSVTLRDTKNPRSKKPINRTVQLTRLAWNVLQGVNRHDPKLVFPITHDIVYDEFQKILKAAGIEDYTFHDLRHEATSTFAERGLTLVELQKLTGHRVLTQLLRYTHLADEHMRQRIDETEDKSYGRVAKFLTTNVPNKGGAAAPSLPKVAAPSGANIVIFRPKPRGG
jgi:integrase